MDRRAFLKNTGYLTLGLSGISHSLGGTMAQAQVSSGNDYKALVCIYLYGGNDANNMVVPLDTRGYQSYATARGQLAIPQGTLCPLQDVGYGLHPSMTEIATLFNSGNAAIVANTGPLIQPTTVKEVLSGNTLLPGNLMDHPSQQALAQTAEGDPVISVGWGGSISDVLTSSLPPGALPMNMSFSGSNTFNNGRSTSYFISPGAPGGLWCPSGWDCSARNNGMQQMLESSSNVILVQQDASLQQNMYKEMNVYNSLVSQATPLKAGFDSSNGLALALMYIANLIQVRSSVGAQRQIFYVGLGSFDTHGAQAATQAAMLTMVSSALGSFAAALSEMGVFDDVTCFTLSDFSRTLQSNSAGGTDHAWGSHHLVIGGAVHGGRLYGTFPTLEPGGPDDIGTTGVWLPTTSTAQFGATMASWFGVQQSDMPTVFPLLSNFSQANLGFV